ncbi:MAG: tRNA (adenosine(37)-N6)-threonylcarbamoyltransferase complex dimerization subunit type 1 TsaB [Eubacteriales bacterium]|nr:tRNA (adenosine(37)-N6)-threonylcarbamoyltransferase complex dimerization subunit type 1 TsaB [Eubacteriales bacterium]
MMMLAIEATSAIATVALFQDGNLLAEREADASKKHAETLLPLIDELLEENGATISQIDLFAVDIGPGSFTGVRIGVSIVNALAFATGKKIVPINALYALSLGAGETERPIAAMIDARNGNAYAALYQAGQTLLDPCAVEIETWKAKLPPDTVLIGDTQAETKTVPRASLVGRAALLHPELAADEVEPVYLRPSQAERTKQNSVREA